MASGLDELMDDGSRLFGERGILRRVNWYRNRNKYLTRCASDQTVFDEDTL